MLLGTSWVLWRQLPYETPGLLLLLFEVLGRRLIDAGYHEAAILEVGPVSGA